MPVTSLSASTATTATSRLKANSSCSGVTVAAMPCGLCAASSRIVGDVRTRSSRPGEVAAANPSRTTSGSSWRVLAPAPRNASTAASATAAFCAWWAPCSGMNTSSYTPPRPCSVEQLPADGELPAQNAELADPRARSSRRPRRSARGSAARASASWRGARSPLLHCGLCPTLAVAMSSMVSPSHSVWSSPMGVITQVLACSTLVESSAPPRPDLDDGDVDRRVGERGQRHRGRHVEVGEALVTGPLVEEAGDRRHLVVDLDELLLVDRLRRRC